MTAPHRFAHPPHQFDAHTHRQPQADDAYASIYNLSVPSPEHLPHAIAWLTAHPWAMVSVGIHPWDSEAWSVADVEVLAPLLSHPQVVAVGECGLDCLRGATLAHQSALFSAQARLAHQHDLPLIIHCVRAQSELLALRRGFAEGLWIVHGFRGKPATAQQLWQKGIATSFGVHYHPITLATCPPHLCYHETDDSLLTFGEVLAQQALDAVQLVEGFEGR